MDLSGVDSKGLLHSRNELRLTRALGLALGRNLIGCTNYILNSYVVNTEYSNRNAGVHDRYNCMRDVGCGLRDAMADAALTN
jgi:hypothetical protein